MASEHVSAASAVRKVPKCARPLDSALKRALAQISPPSHAIRYDAKESCSPFPVSIVPSIALPISSTQSQSGNSVGSRDWGSASTVQAQMPKSRLTTAVASPGMP